MVNTPHEIGNQLKEVVGDKYIINDPNELSVYARDFTSGKTVFPIAVVKPASVEEVSRIAAICNHYRVSITTRGGGTGVSGGTIPSEQGIVLSTERLNKIIEINKIDRIVITETGVVTGTLQDEVLKQGLCFPQNISSRESCFIGGNIAVAGGSPRSLKYGPVKDHVINMEVVLADGQIMWTGKNISKNATGYDLTRLFAGSEGTLGIITKAVLQLVEPAEQLLVLVPFQKIDKLFACVQQIFEQGFWLSAIEFIDHTGINLVTAFTNQSNLFQRDIEGLLWLEFEGKQKELLMESAISVSELSGRFTEEEILIASSASEINTLWSIRNKIGEAVMHGFLFRDLDVVVPRSQIWEMYNAVKRIVGLFDLRYTIIGHIGNGNFHLNIFQEKNTPAITWQQRVDQAVPAIISKAVELGGTISGEHGIGELQRSYLQLAMAGYQINYMRAIKKIFDPNNILNPGKIFG